ncbi:MAG: TRAP transporter TatT component family protein [Verrucomicrobiae bacterium]|nr:TRAP transporter TatT component family protein [Verrucomicrobiae bacterium]
MRAALLVLAVVVCGCKTVSSIRAPESRPGNRGYIYGGPPQSAREVPAPQPEGFEALINAVKSAVAVAEKESAPEKRGEAAKRGIVAARRARELRPDRVEGHYWYAIAVGLLADADRSYGLSAVAEMEAALRRAIEIDERYDNAGPLRVLGLLLLRAPAPPTSIGSPRKALRLLQRAVELFPEYAENYLYLGEALREAGRADEARTAWEKVLNLPAPPGRALEAAEWKKQAGKHLNEQSQR